MTLTVVFLLFPALFVCILLFIEIGRRLGVRHVPTETDQTRAVFSRIETAIYALLGLIIAFTFSGAASRLDDRRTLTVDEANAIGTAYLRLDVLAPATQPPLRENFRKYTEARIAAFRALPDVDAANAHIARGVALQNEIWAGAVAALRDTPQSSILVLPALNEMFDITTKRSIIAQTHIPLVIFGTLVVLTLVSSMMMGYGLPRKGTLIMALHTVVFATVMTAMMYVIFDLDHPRVGLIQLDYADQALLDVLAGMK
jgi:hypothetical protein